MLYLIAKLAQIVSTASFFSWLTMMTFGEKAVLRLLHVLSRDLLVSREMHSTLPTFSAYAPQIFSFAATSASP